MDLEQARALMLTLPHVTETVQWGDNLVFWVGPKAMGGKMFALADLEAKGGVLSFAAGPERFGELLEVEGFRPAPYLARAHWVAAERWDVLSTREWTAALTAGHALVRSRLTKRAEAFLALAPRERKRLLAEHLQRQERQEGSAARPRLRSKRSA